MYSILFMSQAQKDTKKLSSKWIEKESITVDTAYSD